MNVTKLVIHEIEKRQGIQEAHLTLSKKLIVNNNRTLKLVEQLNKSFTIESKVVRTEFEEKERHKFKRDLDVFLENYGESDFLEFSASTIDELASLMRISPFAVGGYYVYANYTNLGREYFAVFIIRDAERLLFRRNQDDTGFVIDETKIVDTNKLAMACRIDLEKYSNDDIRYLHFTNYNQRDISEYFIQWIEASLVDKSKEDTVELLSILKNVDLPVDPETEEEYEEDKFRTKIFDHVNSTGKVVRLRELGANFWDDENFLLNYVEEHDIEINNEFRAIGSVLNRLKKYEIASGNLKVSFKQSDLNERNLRPGDGVNTIIIESAALRNKLDDLLND
jgi:nucleoid-associated protein